MQFHYRANERQSSVENSNQSRRFILSTSSFLSRRISHSQREKYTPDLSQKPFSTTNTICPRCREEKKEERGHCSAESRHLTHHVKSLPYTAPFSEHEGDFSDHRILQRYHRLEQSLVFNLAWFQMDVRAGEDPLDRAVLGRKAPVPTCKRFIHRSVRPAAKLCERYVVEPTGGPLGLSLPYLRILPGSAPFLRFPRGGHSACLLANCKRLQNRVEQKLDVRDSEGCAIFFSFYFFAIFGTSTRLTQRDYFTNYRWLQNRVEQKLDVRDSEGCAIFFLFIFSRYLEQVHD